MFKYSPFRIFLLFCALIVFITSIIIGSIGVHRLLITRQQQRTYTNTTCFVINITDEALPYDCNCDGCYPSTCYEEHFAVQYQIENGTMLSSKIDLEQIPTLLQIEANKTHPCYYDRASVTSVQWFRPNERPDLAMIIAGFSVAGAVVLIVIIVQIRWIIKERMVVKNTHIQF